MRGGVLVAIFHAAVLFDERQLLGGIEHHKSLRNVISLNEPVMVLPHGGAVVAPDVEDQFIFFGFKTHEGAITCSINNETAIAFNISLTAASTSRCAASSGTSNQVS